jgi:hypothetical protein
MKKVLTIFIIQNPKEKLVLRPSDIEKWRNAPDPFLQ